MLRTCICTHAHVTWDHLCIYTYRRYAVIGHARTHTFTYMHGMYILHPHSACATERQSIRRKTSTVIFKITVFFFSIKKLRFNFRSRNAPVRSLFSAFGINIGFCMLKKRQSSWKSEHWQTITRRKKNFSYLSVYIYMAFSFESWVSFSKPEEKGCFSL